MANEDRHYILLELGDNQLIALLVVTAGAGTLVTAIGGNRSRNSIGCYSRS
jgi:hypothetical protein